MPVSFACCQAEVSEAGRSLVQRSPTECGVSKRDREASNNVSNIIKRMEKIYWEKCRSVDQNTPPPSPYIVTTQRFTILFTNGQNLN